MTEPAGPAESESDLPEQILKTDKLGRVRVPFERREAILDEFECSGMSGAAFAARCGINYQTFASWRQKRRRRAEGGALPQASAPGGFLLVEPLGEEVLVRQRGGGLEVELGGGARLLVRSREEAALAAELLRALRP